ncbi:MAG: YkgJ family cysteine cluster protein [Burkholderiales bacterium]|nr:YkgJ family cysteine cluster protein [Burkholderiales bacterium]
MTASPHSHRSPALDCRPGCAACCIAPSISSPMPGLPNGKPAGMPCPHLDAEQRCRLFGQPERPAVCGSLPPSREMCGETREQAMIYLQRLEAATCPDPG